MVLHVPFLRWGSVGNPLTSSSGTAFYCLETAGGEQVIAALAVRTEDNCLIYCASEQVVEEYQGLLHLGTVFSENVPLGVPLFWYFKTLSMSTVVERLPRALWQHFPSDGLSTWVLLRHGSKAWPVEVVNCEFRKGWDDFCQAHELQFEHKLILACERKWVFHAVMFDARGYEFVFDWSHPNARWHDLHPPLGEMIAI
ncbi:hypothetical protein RHGRI_016370 [Rhododendron griersonianum]|uniref:TF-B3 domain-containing protein n=1 Tax=Rhododendron griersonianum TaxID=479676 RepID=A0AAV6JTX4_9ERIC|nr:hypothetical protein RHGRI_016370 [Rhododendron griersonianum]